MSVSTSKGSSSPIPEQTNCEDVNTTLSEFQLVGHAKDAAEGNCSDHRNDLIEMAEAARATAEAIKDRHGDPVEQLRNALEHVVPIALHTCRFLVCKAAYYRANRPACVSLEQYDDWCRQEQDPQVASAFANMTGQDFLATLASKLMKTNEAEMSLVLRQMSEMISNKVGELTACSVCSTKDEDVRLRYVDDDL